jgi:hypothetical protein
VFAEYRIIDVPGMSLIRDLLEDQRLQGDASCRAARGADAFAPPDRSLCALLFQ